MQPQADHDVVDGVTHVLIIENGWSLSLNIFPIPMGISRINLSNDLGQLPLFGIVVEGQDDVGDAGNQTQSQQPLPEKRTTWFR